MNVYELVESIRQGDKSADQTYPVTGVTLALMVDTMQALQQVGTTGKTVWIVEVGCYEGRYVHGAYSSAEAAMAANPLPTRERVTVLRPGGWQRDERGEWDNGLDWDDAARCYPLTIDATE